MMMGMGMGLPVASPTSLVLGRGGGSATVPSAPQNLSAALVEEVNIECSWNAPVSDGGSAITGYKLYYRELTTSPGTCTPRWMKRRLIGQSKSFPAAQVMK